MLDRLGPLGMSSDESGPDIAGRRYTRLRPVYRAEEVTVWLRVFDRAYVVHRLLVGEGVGQDGRGRLPRLRIREGGPHHESHNPRKPLRLPRNAYRTSWLEVQSPVFIESVLRPDPVLWDFTIDPTFMKYVISSRGPQCQLNSPQNLHSWLTTQEELLRRRAART